MEIGSQSFSKKLKKVVFFTHQSFVLQDISSIFSIYFIETGTIQQGQGHVSNVLDPSSFINRLIHEQGKKHKAALLLIAQRGGHNRVIHRYYN